MERKIELAESFYARRSVPTRFQICPAAQPLELDVVLAERGYLVDAPTYVQTASIKEVLAHLKANEEDTVVFLHTRLPAEFADFQQHQYQLSREQAAARYAAFNRIGPEQVYALAMVAGETAGIGMGILERGWLGIFGMMTHPDMRRRGIATAVLLALVRWGQKQGATQTYLQVMENNDKALALYKRAGFIIRYQYHYRQSQ
ncbi:MAG: GNAT family N-acetyltransferase [Gammaproteobacteria bacterium]|nr:GNAT family N-acetyltransferase [Gammaproteobacteria bacterium]